jgi:uracil-DNA glycosylase
MILGHNFDSEVGFRESVQRGKENLKSGTWRSLLVLLKAAGVPLNECFFINAFMGPCKGKNNLDYRGRSDEQFGVACLSFLTAQIELQRPQLIVTLGLHVPPVLARISPGLSPWRGPRLRLKDIDDAPIFFRVGINLGNGSSYQANVAALAHPSMPNSGKRQPLRFPPGKAGEVELIRAGWNRRSR